MVHTASTIAKEESIPSMNRVAPRIMAQKCLSFISSIAVGYAMKARPMLAVFDLSMLLML